MSMENGGRASKKEFTINPFTDVLFESHNIIDLAGYRTPEMASNAVTTPEWSDKRGWRCELAAVKVVDETMRNMDDAPLVSTQYILTRTSVRSGSVDRFLYETDCEGLCRYEGDTPKQIRRDLQEYRTNDVLASLKEFPSDDQTGDDFWDILEEQKDWKVTRPDVQSQKVKRGLIEAARDWYGLSSKSN